MARNQGLIEEGRERFEGARQVKRIQTGLRKSPLVKRAEEQRKLLERRARKLGSELLNSSAVKRAESLRKDAETRLEGQLESLFGLLRIASTSEVSRLERKVDQLNRKLRELEKNSPQAAA